MTVNIYGKQNYIDNGENVKLISPDKHIHMGL